MPDETKPSGTPRTDQLRRAIGKRPAPKPPPPARKAAPAVAAAAAPDVPRLKRNNPRSHPAREARAKARGRLPVGLECHWEWTGVEVVGVYRAYSADGTLVTAIEHRAEGVFRLHEELDILFWEWFARGATAEEKARLVFAQNPPAPAAFPTPGTPAGTGPAPR